MALNYANNQSLSAITALPASISGGALTLLQTQTASSSATIDFTSNIDSTYKEYIFKCYDIHPATDDANFSVNFRDGGSSFDATKTTTVFRAYQNESGTTTSLGYNTATDLAQSTGVQIFGKGQGSDNDQCCVGQIHLFDPSNTTFVKHFIVTSNTVESGDYLNNYYIAGYCNTTSAIDGAQFKFSSGNIDSGELQLYGVS